MFSKKMNDDEIQVQLDYVLENNMYDIEVKKSLVDVLASKERIRMTTFLQALTYLLWQWDDENGRLQSIDDVFIGNFNELFLAFDYIKEEEWNERSAIVRKHKKDNELEVFIYPENIKINEDRNRVCFSMYTEILLENYIAEKLKLQKEKSLTSVYKLSLVKNSFV